jgi:hypothetical protein
LPVREKLGVVGFVVLLVAVWGAGFLWVSGNLPWTSGQPTAANVSPSATAAPTPSPSASASQPAAPPTSANKARAGALTTTAEERKPVDINPAGSRPQPRPLPPVARFTMATFNVLGHSHTNPGGHHAWLASGPQRVGGVLQLLGQHDVSVVGMQEFQRPQRVAFASRARGWQMYPTLSMPARDGENTVAWRTDTWELVRPATVAIPYFNGRSRQMPYVLLRHKETGVQAYFSTFHNPADTRRFRGQQRFRNAATERQIDLFNRLDREGVPQFVTGDMNERAEYFCKVTGRAPLVAAAGGSSSGGCRPPRPMMIDWIFGSAAAEFSNYRVDRGGLVRRTSDHPLVVAEVTIDALEFDRATAGTTP